jgi:amino acid permease
MATELQTSSTDTASLTGLVTGIVNDAQELLQQQLALFRSEIKQDLSRSKEMASSFVVGGVLGLVAAGLLTFMLVYLVEYFTKWHLAGCFALVGGITAAVAGFFIWRAVSKLERFKPLDQTTEAIQENLEWKTNETRR